MDGSARPTATSPNILIGIPNIATCTPAQEPSGKEAADMLGIGEPTVRTHLKRIFAKTDTTRQADLVRLLQNATPPIMAPQPRDQRATQRRSETGSGILRSDDAATAADL